MSNILNRGMNYLHRVLAQIHWLGYIFLIAPPRAIDITHAQRSKQGELARQPLYVVMLVELMIRIALMLVIAMGTELMLGDELYEIFRLDIAYTIVVLAGIAHSLSYLLLLGYLKSAIGAERAMRVYRLVRNLCYAAIPGLLIVIPWLIWKWNRGLPLFEDGLVFLTYSLITLFMATVGVIEAAVMTRKPLGLDRNLDQE